MQARISRAHVLITASSSPSDHQHSGSIISPSWPVTSTTASGDGIEKVEKYEKLSGSWIIMILLFVHLFFSGFILVGSAAQLIMTFVLFKSCLCLSLLWINGIFSGFFLFTIFGKCHFLFSVFNCNLISYHCATASGDPYIPKRRCCLLEMWLEDPSSVKLHQFVVLVDLC